jgi:hypothetical protein
MVYSKVPPRAPWRSVPSSSEISSFSDPLDKAAYDPYPFVNTEDQKKFQGIFGEYGPDVLARIIPYGKQILGGSPVIIGVEYIAEGFGNIRLESGYGRIGVSSSIEDYKNLHELAVRFRKNGDRK